MWDEITYPFPYFNSVTVEVWEWISNFISHFYWPCDYLSKVGSNSSCTMGRASCTNKEVEHKSKTPNICCLSTHQTDTNLILTVLGQTKIGLIWISQTCLKLSAQLMCYEDILLSHCNTLCDIMSLLLDEFSN